MVDPGSASRISRTGLLARVYDRLTAPLERRVLAGWRRALWARVPAESVLPGLEVGAGTGANFRHYPPGARVVATDVSWRMLREARAKRAEAPPGSELWLVVADAGRLPFRDGAFGWAAETLVFCEVAEPAGALAEVGRTLRPGAPLLMLEHVRPGGWLGRAADLVTRLTGPLWGEHFDRDAAAAVRRAGLVVRHEAWLWRDAVTLIEAGAPPGQGLA